MNGDLLLGIGSPNGKTAVEELQERVAAQPWARREAAGEAWRNRPSHKPGFAMATAVNAMTRGGEQDGALYFGSDVQGRAATEAVSAGMHTYMALVEPSAADPTRVSTPYKFATMGTDLDARALSALEQHGSLLEIRARECGDKVLKVIPSAVTPGDLRRLDAAVRGPEDGLERDGGFAEAGQAQLRARFCMGRLASGRYSEGTEARLAGVLSWTDMLYLKGDLDPLTLWAATSAGDPEQREDHGSAVAAWERTAGRLPWVNGASGVYTTMVVRHHYDASGALRFVHVLNDGVRAAVHHGCYRVLAVQFDNKAEGGAPVRSATFSTDIRRDAQIDLSDPRSGSFLQPVLLGKEGRAGGPCDELLGLDTLGLDDMRQLRLLCEVDDGSDGSDAFHTMQANRSEARAALLCRCDLSLVDGRCLSRRYNDRRTCFYTGPPGRERLAATRYDFHPSNGRMAGVVQFYKGPAGRVYLHRNVLADGTVVTFRGTTPGAVSVASRWRPDGTFERLEGPRDSERVVDVTHRPRDPAALAGLGVTAAPADPTPFELGAEVRPVLLIGRPDLLHRKGVVVGWYPDVGRVGVQFEGVRDIARISPAKLVAEYDFEEYKSALALSKKLKSQGEHPKKKSPTRCKPPVVPQNEPPRVVLPFVAKHCSERSLLSCSVGGSLMTDAVLASDGFVYSHAALSEYVKKHGFVSPVTGHAMAPQMCANLTIRSAAKAWADGHVECKGGGIIEAPEWLTCPISAEVMREPVLAADGFLYERSSIEQWIATGSGASPMTNAPMNGSLTSDIFTKRIAAVWL